MALAEAPRTDAYAAPLFRAGMTYLNRGWSIIPITPGKKTPLIKWEPYQKQLTDADELLGWVETWPTMNLAIVTGELSGLTVLDVDERSGGVQSLVAAQIELPPTRIAKTPHGWHYYYRYDARVHTVAEYAKLPGVDIRSDGGYVLAPPSRLMAE